MDSSLPNGLRVYARDCVVAPVEEAEANAFLEEHHRQGTIRGKLTFCGLYHNNDLLGLAAFGQPRTPAMKRTYSRELLRLCFKKKVRVVGGASKLIAHYKTTFSPPDLFTYQDATGEATAVYEHCGFTLVKEGGRKSYLVAPGRTLETATRREALGLAYATRYGPDRILGTSLGEVWVGDRRMSNKELFLERLGWHEEFTAGDKVYEWINPEYTFYTYKITATDSNKYYYGVSHVKKQNATVKDCATDGYWGSGGTKYTNWKNRHKANLVKEVIGRYSRKKEAYKAERELIGDLYHNDPLCLNSTLGGGEGGRNGWSEACALRTATCEVHGPTKFIGAHCRRCLTQRALTQKECPTHGLTVFLGATCAKCSGERQVTLQKCEKHGFTKFLKDHCYKCLYAKRHSQGVCEVHGLTSFTGDTCLKCSTAPVRMVCEEHGETAHINGKCMVCRNQATTTQGECPVHGFTAFKGDSCYKCWAARSVEKGHCPVHGEAKFRKGACCKCTYAAKNITIKTCPYHGEVKHHKDKCYSCRGEESAHKHLHKDRFEITCRYCQQREE